jgi:hypothetical protein
MIVGVAETDGEGVGEVERDGDGEGDGDGETDGETDVVVGGTVVGVGVVVGGTVVGGAVVVVVPGFGRVVRRGGGVVAGTVVGGTLTDGVAPVGGEDEGSSLGDSLGPADGGVTTTPSPQVRSRDVAPTGAPPTATDPVDTVTAPGSTAYHASPVFLTSPFGRRTTSESGRYAPLVLVVSASRRPVSTPRVPCGARCRPVAVQSTPTFVREPAQSTTVDPPENVSRPADLGGTSIQEPAPT